MYVYIPVHTYVFEYALLCMDHLLCTLFPTVCPPASLCDNGSQ